MAVHLDCFDGVFLVPKRLRKGVVVLVYCSESSVAAETQRGRFCFGTVGLPEYGSVKYGTFVSTAKMIPRYFQVFCPQNLVAVLTRLRERLVVMMVLLGAPLPLRLKEVLL